MQLNGFLSQQTLKVLSLDAIKIICHFIILFLIDHELRLKFEQQNIVLVYVNRSDTHPHVFNYIQICKCPFWIMLSINSMVGFNREIFS